MTRINKKKSFNLDCGFRQIQGSCQLASPGSGDVILPIKLLLQPSDLLAGERGPVPPHLVGGVGQRRLARPVLPRIRIAFTREDG